MGSRSSGKTMAYIGLGSNLGDRENYLLQALRLLDTGPSVRILRISDLYETEPVGYTDQPKFLNMAAALETVLPPKDLLALLLQVERELGRTRDIRWGPRTVDLDLLLYGTERIEEPELTVPHPRMLERPFVLIPLADVAAGAELPVGFTLEEQLRQLNGREGVNRWKPMHWPNEYGPSVN